MRGAHRQHRAASDELRPRNARAGRYGYVIKDKIDQHVFNKPVAFSGVNDLDNGSLSGGAANGTPITTSSSNIDDVANSIIEKMASETPHLSAVSFGRSHRLS